MANSPQAKKRARQEQKRRAHNVSMRSMMRTYQKKAQKAIESKQLDKANESYKKMASVMDKLANKGIITKNKAARHKHRFNKKLKALAA